MDKEKTEPKEDIDSGMSSESDVGFPTYEVPDSIKTAILSRHSTYGATVDSDKYYPYDLDDMYMKGLNDGMKRAVEPDSPIIEEIVKKAVDKLSKSKEIELTKTGEWIILRMSMGVPGTTKIKYTCSNCEKEYTCTIFSRELPNYCENCGSKNSVRDDSEKVSW